MTEIIDTITPFLYQSRYVFAFLGSLLEGANIMLVCGFLYRLDLFKFWNILTVLLIGYILNGYLCYALGRFGGRKVLEKFGPKLFLTKTRIKKIEKYFRRHTIKALLLTRMTYGIGGYVYILAGIFRTKAKKFFWCNVLASMVWVMTTFFIGYTFGISYDLLSDVVKTIAVWMMVVLFILLMLGAIWFVYWLRRIAKTKLLEKMGNHKSWQTLKWVGKKIINLFNDT